MTGGDQGRRNGRRGTLAALCYVWSHLRRQQTDCSDRRLIVGARSRSQQHLLVKASLAAEKSWIDSTLIISLRNGGGRGQKGPYATAK